MYWMFGGAALFFLSCRRKKYTLYEVKQEVFCGSGKRVLLYLIVISAALKMLTVSVFAEKKAEEYFDEEVVINSEVSEDIFQDGKREQENLNVILYDSRGHKLLIKKDAVWKVSEDIILSIPMDELEKTEGKVTVLYEDKNGGNIKKYEVNCCRKW